ncbi:MAG: hypothetical protein Ct9H300mP16_10850 [Pseudomonadota bacterium]|nr:MAG: hypothetical protein Ct9H300mP16_10850 [Pseudomonadota bacterium]
MPMYQFRHPGMERDVVLTPEPDLGTHISGVMNVALLGTYYRPAALSITARMWAATEGSFVRRPCSGAPGRSGYGQLRGRFLPVQIEPLGVGVVCFQTSLHRSIRFRGTRKAVYGLLTYMRGARASVAAMTAPGKARKRPQ